MGPTDQYYDQFAAEFFGSTVGVDMAQIHQRFLAELTPGARILDAGCGSGRDARAFSEAGFQVTAFDASAELARLASTHCGFEVAVRRFEDVDEVETFDGIWCCASLLHVPLAAMPATLDRLWRALRPGGTLYLSFKHGTGERVHGGRRFTDADEATLRQWFSRRLDGSGERYVYEFSAYLTGPRKLWQESTRPNALFLSTAAQLNSDLLGPVARWLVQGLVYLPAGAFIDHAFMTALLESKEGRAAVRDFLATADISIAEVSAVPRKGLRGQVMFQPGGVAQARQEEGEFLFPIFEHRTEQGSAKFELHEESEGTQRLFSLAAPVLDVLKHGRVLVVDELDRSLHTLLVRRLVGMFHDPVLNPHGAQLVFSTHDTSLLDHTLFRRDQVWFAEKDGTQGTRIFPLSDFSPRKHEAWERGYLMGRYGAVPMFSALPETASSAVAPSAPSAPGAPVTV